MNPADLSTTSSGIGGAGRGWARLVGVRGLGRGRRSTTLITGFVLLAASMLPLQSVRPALASPATSTAFAPSGFVLPVAPPPLVLTPFAPPANRYGAGHRGVDLAGQPGATVLAAGTGVVVFAAQLAGRGVVSIEHSGGLRTTYEPVTASVTAGSTVAVGRPIGVLEPGHAGCAPASCLHWGARLPDRVYLDPMSLLEPWRVRLWPWDGRPR